jgi:hypothetical protein
VHPVGDAASKWQVWMVVDVVVEVVVVVRPTTVFSTGAQKSRGAPTGSGPSVPNWSRRVTWIDLVGNFVTDAHWGSVGGHVVLPLIV